MKRKKHPVQCSNALRVLCSGLIATRSLAAVSLMFATGAAWASPNIQSVPVTFPGGTPTLAINGIGFGGGTVNVRLGGYWVASQAGEFYAAPGAEVGSIGVYTLHADVSEALKQDGVSMSLISAGRFKTEATAPPVLSQPGVAH